MENNINVPNHQPVPQLYVCGPFFCVMSDISVRVANDAKPVTGNVTLSTKSSSPPSNDVKNKGNPNYPPFIGIFLVISL